MMRRSAKTRFMFLAASAFIGCGALAKEAPTPRPERVTIETGVLEGSIAGGVISFKGIPYAAPPIEDLRWRAPQPLTPWSGVRRATGYGNDCVQMPLPGDAGASGSTRGEDCLVLNIWRPASLARGERLPVMVWIHGGGFLNGAASVPFFDGSAFARDGVVLVGINYRLGRMGFFAHPALTAARGRPLANYGLMDQLAALRWVQRNVAAFGGDPGQVTIAGESAGGISVMHLLTWPEARGLFHRAAVLSGGGRTYIGQVRDLSTARGSLPSAEESGLAFARSVGITDSGEPGLMALRRLSAEKVNGEMSMAALAPPIPTYTGGPVNDGIVLTAQPQQHILKGNFAKVPLLIGTTVSDIAVQFPPDRTRPLEFFGADAEHAEQLYDPHGKLPVNELATTIAADMTVHEPARFVAQRMTAAGMPAWIYRFDYVAEHLRPKVGHATHASELCYLFDQPEARYGADVTERDRVMARLFHAYFVNFVTSGDPNGVGLAGWDKVDPAKADIMIFGNDATAKMQRDPWGERLALVKRKLDARVAR